MTAEDPLKASAIVLTIDIMCTRQRINAHLGAASRAEDVIHGWEDAIEHEYTRLIDSYGGIKAVEKLLEELRRFAAVHRWHAKVIRTKELAELTEAQAVLDGRRLDAALLTEE
jgi:hypothetical protein